MNAGHVKIGDLGTDGIVQQRGVVGHRFAAVAARDDRARDGIDQTPGEWGMGHAKVTRVLMDDDWNRKGPEELAGRVLQQADPYALAEALEAGAIGRV